MLHGQLNTLRRQIITAEHRTILFQEKQRDQVEGKPAFSLIALFFLNILLFGRLTPLEPILKIER
jgi:hypothetical protein